MNNELNYNILIDKAMRDIVKYALKKAQKIRDENLCFLFTINTKNKNVVLPNYIKEQYPDKITIILQHQFSNLEVKNSSFSVDLCFGGKKEHIVVPFSSLLVFSDKLAGMELNFSYYGSVFVYEDDYEDNFIEEYCYYEEENAANNNFEKNNLINFEDLRRRK